MHWTWIKLLTSLALGPSLPLQVLSLQSWLCRERGKGDRLLHFLCRRIVTWRGSSDRVALLGSSDRDYRPQWELSRQKDHKGQSVGGWPELSKGLEQEMDKGLALLFLVGIPWKFFWGEIGGRLLFYFLFLSRSKTPDDQTLLSEIVRQHYGVWAVWEKETICFVFQNKWA